MIKSLYHGGPGGHGGSLVVFITYLELASCFSEVEVENDQLDVVVVQQ
jgi:hypothetical protein